MVQNNEKNNKKTDQNLGPVELRLSLSTRRQQIGISRYLLPPRNLMLEVVSDGGQRSQRFDSPRHVSSLSRLFRIPHIVAQG